jgi:O-antigen/teichoic acid export membrane protein
VTTTSEPRGLLSNTLASAAATFWVAALTVVSVPVLIRLLGVSEYGVWVLITVLAVQGRGLGSLLDLGLSQSVIQRVAATDDHERAGHHVGAGVRLLAAVGLVAAVALLVAAPALVDAFSITTARSAAVTAVRLLGLQLVVELPAVALGAGLEGLRRYEVKRTIDAVRATAFAVGAIVIAASGGSVAGLAAWSVVTTALTAIAFVVALRHFGIHPFAGGSARAEARAGMPLLALRATGVGYRQLDRIVLGLVVSTVAVAGFDVAEKVNLVALTALGAATSALIPAAAFGLRTDRDRTRVLAVRATRWSAAVTVPLAAFVFGAAGPLARLVAGSDIAGATAAIRWLAAATVVSVVFAAAFEMAIGAAAASRLVPVSLGGLALNLVATVILARRYGLAGSAAATFVAAVAVLPVVARICGEVFDHSTAVLVRACLPGFGLGLAVAVTAAGALALVPGVGGLVLGASVSAIVVGGGLLSLHRRERSPMAPATVVAGTV